LRARINLNGNKFGAIKSKARSNKGGELLPGKKSPGGGREWGGHGGIGSVNCSVNRGEEQALHTVAARRARVPRKEEGLSPLRAKNWSSRERGGVRFLVDLGKRWEWQC